MGLSSTLQQAVVTAFLAMGDLPKPATYQSVNGVTRDIVAGTITPNITEYAVQGALFSRFKSSEEDKDVQVMTDAKFICPQLWLDVTPKVGDLILDAQSRTWEVIRDMSDPAQAAVILQVRTSR